MSSTKEDMFVFRQRAGALDWPKLAALDVDELIANSAVGSLQSLVDSATFSEITQDDLDHSPKGSTLNLVRTMQLMMEYVLTGQEQQAEKIQKLYYRYSGLKRKCAKLETANVRLRDDVGVYRDELQVIRMVQGRSDPNDGRDAGAGNDKENNSNAAKRKGPQLPKIIRNADGTTPGEEVAPPSSTTGNGNCSGSDDDNDTVAEPLSHGDIDLRLHIARLFEQQRELIEEKVVKVNTQQESRGKSAKAAISISQETQMEETRGRVDSLAEQLQRTLDAFQQQVAFQAELIQQQQQGGSSMHAPLSTSTGASPYRKKPRGSPDTSLSMDISPSTVASERSASRRQRSAMVPVPMNDNGNSSRKQKMHRSAFGDSQSDSDSGDEGGGEGGNNDDVTHVEVDFGADSSDTGISGASVLSEGVQASLKDWNTAAASPIAKGTNASTTYVDVLKRSPSANTSTATMATMATSTTHLEQLKEAELAEKSVRDEEADRMQRAAIGAKMVRARMANAEKWSSLRAFRRWIDLTTSKREVEQYHREFNALQKAEANEAIAARGKEKEKALARELELQRVKNLANTEAAAAVQDSLVAAAAAEAVAHAAAVEREKFVKLLQQKEAESLEIARLGIEEARVEAEALVKAEQARARSTTAVAASPAASPVKQPVRAATTTVDSAVMTSLDFTSHPDSGASSSSGAGGWKTVVARPPVVGVASSSTSTGTGMGTKAEAEAEDDLMNLSVASDVSYPVSGAGANTGTGTCASATNAAEMEDSAAFSFDVSQSTNADMDFVSPATTSGSATGGGSVVLKTSGSSSSAQIDSSESAASAAAAGSVEGEASHAAKPAKPGRPVKPEKQTQGKPEKTGKPKPEKQGKPAAALVIASAVSAHVHKPAKPGKPVKSPLSSPVSQKQQQQQQQQQGPWKCCFVHGAFVRNKPSNGGKNIGEIDLNDVVAITGSFATDTDTDTTEGGSGGSSGLRYVELAKSEAYPSGGWVPVASAAGKAIMEPAAGGPTAPSTGATAAPALSTSAAATANVNEINEMRSFDDSDFYEIEELDSLREAEADDADVSTDDLLAAQQRIASAKSSASVNSGVSTSTKQGLTQW